MSTPNNCFETLTTETLATATGGFVSGTGSTSNWQLHQQLSPILHSLKDLNSNSANNSQNQQNQTMMMMVAALAARR
jgi:hypothetical protein